MNRMNRMNDTNRLSSRFPMRGVSGCALIEAGMPVQECPLYLASIRPDATLVLLILLILSISSVSNAT